jgi:hypothetical protein
MGRKGNPPKNGGKVRKKSCPHAMQDPILEIQEAWIVNASAAFDDLHIAILVSFLLSLKDQGIGTGKQKLDIDDTKLRDKAWHKQRNGRQYQWPTFFQNVQQKLLSGFGQELDHDKDV